MKKKKNKGYGVLYIQESRPRKKILKWIDGLLEDGKIVYFQSGTPPPPPGGGHPGGS